MPPDSSTSQQLERADPPAADSPYWRFHAEVVNRQVAAWLPAGPARVLDLSGAGSRFADTLRRSGHTVIVGDPTRLDWLAGEAVDAVLAEDRALSLVLATEITVDEIARVLRPGGRLLASVDSLVLGLARLAGQARWAELADVPGADVVLVPAEDGSIRRCFWPEELAAAISDAGLSVEWIRPRTVLAPAVVERALQADPAALPRLTETELALAVEHQGESIGSHLVFSARKPAVVPTARS